MNDSLRATVRTPMQTIHPCHVAIDYLHIHLKFEFEIGAIYLNFEFEKYFSLSHLFIYIVLVDHSGGVCVFPPQGNYAVAGGGS